MNEPAKIKVFIIDDHPVTRGGITALVNQQKDLEVCGEAEGYRDAVKALKSTAPDIAIVDISLKDGSGLALIEDIKKTSPQVHILVLSMHEESLYAKKAFQSGAEGYVTKSEHPKQVLTAIRRIMEGTIFIKPELKDAIFIELLRPKHKDDSSPAGRLTGRELYVFRCIGNGMTTRAIAENMSLSIKTVQNHKENIKSKLELSGATELVQQAALWVKNENPL